jgi:hypothetical protein
MKTTREVADSIRVLPHTLHAAVCRQGHYFNVRPLKCPNGRLLWPNDAAEQILGIKQQPSISHDGGA